MLLVLLTYMYAHFNMAVADCHLRVFSQAEITKSSSFWWSIIYIYVIPSDQFDICFLFSYSPMWDHWSTTLTGWMIWYSAWMGETVSEEWEIWFVFNETLVATAKHRSCWTKKRTGTKSPDVLAWSSWLCRCGRCHWALRLCLYVCS